MPRLTARALAAKYNVSVALVSAIEDRIMPIEKGKRGYQWDLAEQAEALQAEGVEKWAEVFGELVDLEARTLYEYAKTWALFHDQPKVWRLSLRFSAWQVLARYFHCEGAIELFTQWERDGYPPRVDVLRGMMAARFGNEPTPAASRAKVGRLYKSLEGLQVDFYNTMPDGAKQELAIAFKHVAKAKEIMEVKHG